VLPVVDHDDRVDTDVKQSFDPGLLCVAVLPVHHISHMLLALNQRLFVDLH
jgi:hypothetical protein